MKKYYEFDFYKSNMMNILKNPSQRVSLSSLSDEEIYSNDNIASLRTDQVMALTVQYLSNKLFPLMKSLQDTYGHVFVNDLALEDDPSFMSVYFNISSNLFKVRKGRAYMPEPKTVKEGGIQITFDDQASDDKKVTFQEQLGLDERTYKWDEQKQRWVKYSSDEKRTRTARWSSSLRNLIYGIKQIDYWIQAKKEWNKTTNQYDYIPVVFKIDQQFKDLKTNNKKLIKAIESSFVFKKQKALYEKYKLEEYVEDIPKSDRYNFFKAKAKFEPETGKWSKLKAELLNGTISVADKGYLINEFGVFYRKGKQIKTRSEAEKAFKQFSQHLVGSNIFDILSTEKNDDGRFEPTSYFINSVQFNDLSPQVEDQLTQKADLIGKDLSITIQFSFDRLKNEFSSSMRILDEKNSTLGFFIDKFDSKDIADKVKEQKEHLQSESGAGLTSQEYRVIHLYYGNILELLQNFIESNFNEFLNNPKEYMESSEKDLDEYDQNLLKRTLSSVFDFEIEGEDTTTVVDTTKPITEPTEPITEPVTETSIVFNDKERLIIENLAARFSYLSQKKKDKPTDTEPPPVDRPDQVYIWDQKSDSYTVYTVAPLVDGHESLTYTGMQQLAIFREGDDDGIIAFYHPDQGTYILIDEESGGILNRRFKVMLEDAILFVRQDLIKVIDNKGFKWLKLIYDYASRLSRSVPQAEEIDLVLDTLFVGNLKTMTSPVYNEQWKKTNITNKKEKYNHLKRLAEQQLSGAKVLITLAKKMPQSYNYSQTQNSSWIVNYLAHKSVTPQFFWFAYQMYNPRISMDYIVEALDKRMKEAKSLLDQIKEREERLKSSSKTEKKEGETKGEINEKRQQFLDLSKGTTFKLREIIILALPSIQFDLNNLGYPNPKEIDLYAGMTDDRLLSVKVPPYFMLRNKFNRLTKYGFQYFHGNDLKARVGLLNAVRSYRLLITIVLILSIINWARYSEKYRIDFRRMSGKEGLNVFIKKIQKNENIEATKSLTEYIKLADKYCVGLGQIANFFNYLTVDPKDFDSKFKLSDRLVQLSKVTNEWMKTKDDGAGFAKANITQWEYATDRLYAHGSGTGGRASDLKIKDRIYGLFLSKEFTDKNISLVYSRESFEIICNAFTPFFRIKYGTQGVYLLPLSRHFPVYLAINSTLGVTAKGVGKASISMSLYSSSKGETIDGKIMQKLGVRYIQRPKQTDKKGKWIIKMINYIGKAINVYEENKTFYNGISKDDFV